LNIFGISIHLCHVAKKHEIDNALSQINPLEYTKKVSDPDSKNSGWSCKLNTGHGENLKGDWCNIFIDCIQQHVIDYIESIKVKGQFNVGILDPWINAYELNDFQEVHDHAGGNVVLSYCYFHKLPVDGGNFIFYNSIGKNNSFGQPVNPFVRTIDTHYIPQVSEGDLIIFPSWLDHMVSHNKSSNYRITLSGNISIEKIPDEETEL